jgi:hypothetical protein
VHAEIDGDNPTRAWNVERLAKHILMAHARAKVPGATVAGPKWTLLAGPESVTAIDPTDLHVRLSVNDVWKQDGRSSDMVFGPFELMSFVSQVMTLLPGDVIATGTPPGVGPVVDGDRVALEVESVGRLELTVTSS